MFSFFFFFFNDTATTEIYTLSLHDALPISATPSAHSPNCHPACPEQSRREWRSFFSETRLPRVSEKKERSEEHTSELQSRQYLVCRLLLEKKKNQRNMCCCLWKSHIIRLDT